MTKLSVQHLKKYFQDVKAVDGISFDVAEGEILGLLGPNGAGKSTTISIISTLLTADEGNVTYEGKAVSMLNQEFKMKMGVVPQEIALYPTLSGYENLKFFGEVYGLRGDKLKKRIEEVKEIIGITDRITKRVDTYSGGMKRRLNIGCALLHEPEFLIMDEPTVGIDPQSRNHILATIKKLNEQGITIIYTSHYMEEVEYLCDRICIMDMGKVIAKGTKAELLSMMKQEYHYRIDAEGSIDSFVNVCKGLNVFKKVEKLDDGVHVYADQNGQLLNQIISAAHDSQLSITTIEAIQPDLEDIFLKLTGKGLRD